MGSASHLWILALVQWGGILLLTIGGIVAVVLVVRALRGIDRSLRRLVEHHDIQVMLHDDDQGEDDQRDGEPETPAPEPERP